MNPATIPHNSRIASAPRRKPSARERRLLRLERLAANLAGLRRAIVGDIERVSTETEPGIPNRDAGEREAKLERARAENRNAVNAAAREAYRVQRLLNGLPYRARKSRVSTTETRS
jgi:hypothetical protein